MSAELLPATDTAAYLELLRTQLLRAQMRREAGYEAAIYFAISELESGRFRAAPQAVDVKPARWIVDALMNAEWSSDREAREILDALTKRVVERGEGCTDDYPRRVAIRSHCDPPIDGTIGVEICRMSGVHARTLADAESLAACFNAAPALLDQLAALDAEVARLKQALAWYAEQVEGCRKLTGDGDSARHALDRDGGKRARAALAAPTEPAGKEAVVRASDILAAIKADADGLEYGSGLIETLRALCARASSGKEPETK